MKQGLLGNTIRQARLDCKMTQEELADRSKLSKGFISQVENNLTSPSIATLIDILQCLGTDLKHFFSDDEDDQIESEHRKPSVEVLFALVSVLHISLDALLIPESAQSQTRKIHQINSMLPDCTDDELDVLLAALHELERQKRIKE